MKPIEKNVITVPKETTVDFLKEPEVSFVSLVRQGANNTPFRVVKENKGGGMNKVVQAIRILKDSKVDLKTIVGKDFREDTVTEDGNYLIYEQVDKAVCAPDTKSVVAIDPKNHVYAITYELLADKKGKDVPTVVPQTIVLKEDVKELDYWDVWSEMYAMMDLISGAMGQSNMKETDMKSLVLLSIDNFRVFCETLFSGAKSNGSPSIGEKAVKFIEMLQKQILSEKANKKEEDTMFELKDKEELVGIIATTVEKAMDKRAEVDAKSAETKAAAQKAEDERIAKETEMTELKASVKSLTENIEKLSGTVISKTVAADPDNPNTLKKEGVYSGMFNNSNMFSSGKATNPGISGSE